MENNKIYQFCLRHKAETAGAIIGFLISIIILVIGLFKTLFIAFVTAFGYYIGKKVSMDKDFFKRILDKILPPGTYR